MERGRGLELCDKHLGCVSGSACHRSAKHKKSSKLPSIKGFLSHCIKRCIKTQKLPSSGHSELTIDVHS